MLLYSSNSCKNISLSNLSFKLQIFRVQTKISKSVSWELLLAPLHHWHTCTSPSWQSWHCCCRRVTLCYTQITSNAACLSGMNKQLRCTRTSAWRSPGWYLSWRTSSWTSSRRSNSRTLRWRTWHSPSNGEKQADALMFLSLQVTSQWVVRMIFKRLFEGTKTTQNCFKKWLSFCVYWQSILRSTLLKNKIQPLSSALRWLKKISKALLLSEKKNSTMFTSCKTKTHVARCTCTPDAGVWTVGSS